METSFDMSQMQGIMKLQQMQEKMEELSSQLEQIQEKHETITITLNALDEIKGTLKGSEILSPIADGIFIKTKLDDNSTAIVNIGNGITVEKSIREVIEMVRGHEVKIRTQSQEIDHAMQKLSSELLESIAVMEIKNNNLKIDEGME